MVDQTNESSDETTHPGTGERIYVLRRADDHRRMAEQAEQAGTKAIHLRLEQLYWQRLDGVDVVQTD